MPLGKTIMQRRLHCGTPSPPPPPKGERCCKASHGPIGPAVAGSGRTDSEEEEGVEQEEEGLEKEEEVEKEERKEGNYYINADCRY